MKANIANIMVYTNKMFNLGMANSSVKCKKVFDMTVLNPVTRNIMLTLKDNGIF